MATVGTLLIDIAANTARLQQDMEQAKSTVDKAMAGIASAANIAKTALGALGVGATIAGIKGFVTSTAEAVGALKTLSDQTGVSVERLSAFRTVAKYADTDLASVATGIQKLSKTMYEAASSGSSTPARIFQAMGVEVKTAEGTLRSADTVMQEVAKTLANMTDEAQRVALAQQLFGKSGAQLLPFLLDLAKAGELNAKVTTEQAQAAKDFDDNLKRLAASSNAWKTALVNDLIPSLNEMLTTMMRIKALGVEGIFGLSGKETASPMGAIDQWSAKLARLKQQREEIANSAANKTPILRDIPGLGTSGDIAVLDSQIAFAEAKVSTLRKLVSNDIKTLPPLEEPPVAKNIAVPDIDKTKADRFDAMVEEGRSLEMQNRQLDEARELGAKFLLGEQKKIDAAQMLAAELVGGLSPALAEFNKVQERVNQAVEAGTLNQEQADAVLQQAAIRYQDAVDKLDAYKNMVDALSKSYGAILTPQEKYAKTLGEIATLQAAGKMDAEQAARQQVRAAEDYQKALRDTSDETKRTEDFARQLGMTFSSAFEDAIVKGKGLRDTLNGLLQDILRIMLRTQITQPAAAAIGSWVNGTFGTTKPVTSNGWVSAEGGTGYSTSLAGTTIPQFADGASMVTQGGLAWIHAGEAVVPAEANRWNGGGGGVVVNVHNQPGQTAEVAQRQGANGMELDIIIQRVEAGMARNVQRGQGIAPTLERQYSLNRAAGAFR